VVANSCRTFCDRPVPPVRLKGQVVDNKQRRQFRPLLLPMQLGNDHHNLVVDIRQPPCWWFHLLSYCSELTLVSDSLYPLWQPHFKHLPDSRCCAVPRLATLHQAFRSCNSYINDSTGRFGMHLHSREKVMLRVGSVACLSEPCLSNFRQRR
jgi:hypothetical protein